MIRPSTTPRFLGQRRGVELDEAAAPGGQMQVGPAAPNLAAPLCNASASPQASGPLRSAARWGSCSAYASPSAPNASSWTERDIERPRPPDPRELPRRGGRSRPACHTLAGRHSGRGLLRRPAARPRRRTVPPPPGGSLVTGDAGGSGTRAGRWGHSPSLCSTMPMILVPRSR